MYYCAPIAFTDPLILTAITSVYEEYLEDVIIGTIATAYLKRRDYEDYRFMWGEFMKRISEAIKAECRRTGHKQIQVLK